MTEHLSKRIVDEGIAVMIMDGAYLKYAFDYFNSYGNQPFHFMEETVFLIIGHKIDIQFRLIEYCLCS
jgi:hypothetical protein